MGVITAFGATKVLFSIAPGRPFILIRIVIRLLWPKTLLEEACIRVLSTLKWSLDRSYCFWSAATTSPNNSVLTPWWIPIDSEGRVILDWIINAQADNQRVLNLLDLRIMKRICSNKALNKRSGVPWLGIDQAELPIDVGERLIEQDFDES
jgi:hypothetical protein